MRSLRLQAMVLPSYRWEQAAQCRPSIATVVTYLRSHNPYSHTTFTVSGNLIRIPKWGNILLETGEGTWGQLARYFGTSPGSDENVWNILRDTKCIFVSHAHGDHHMGLAKILAMRKKASLSTLPKHLY